MCMTMRFDRSAAKSWERVGDRLRVTASFSRVADEAKPLFYMRSDGTVQPELLTPEELFSPESLDTAGLCPVTYGHPKSGRSDWRKDSIGATGSKVVARQDAGLVDIVFVLADSKVIEEAEEAAKKGKPLQVSAGYETEVVERDGKFYQTKRRYDHFAILPPGQLGRAGDTVALHMDSDDWGVQVEKIDDVEITRKDAMKKVKLNGKDYEMDGGMYEDMMAHFAKGKKSEEDKKDSEDSALRELCDRLRSDCQAAQVRADAAEELLQQTREKLNAIGDINARVQLEIKKRQDAIEAASPYLPADFKADAAPTIRDLYLKAIGNTIPQTATKLDSAELPEIERVFEMMRELHPITQDAAPSVADQLFDQIQVARTSPRADSSMSNLDQIRAKLAQPSNGRSSN